MRPRSWGFVEEIKALSLTGCRLWFEYWRSEIWLHPPLRGTCFFSPSPWKMVWQATQLHVQVQSFFFLRGPTEGNPIHDRQLQTKPSEVRLNTSMDIWLVRNTKCYIHRLSCLFACIKIHRNFIYKEFFKVIKNEDQSMCSFFSIFVWFYSHKRKD